MSEISQHKQQRINQLRIVFYAILHKEAALVTINANKQTIELTQASDIIELVDTLMQEQIPMDQLKIGINKFINTLGKTIRSFPEVQFEEDSFLWTCMQNNHEIDKKLKTLRPKISELNKNPEDALIKNELYLQLNELLTIDRYYTIKENVLFPLLEKHWKNYRCLQLMWSFHDDIRSKLKDAIHALNSENLDLQLFNRAIGDFFFTTYAIILRDERILFPFILETIPTEIIDNLLFESNEIGFPFAHSKAKSTSKAPQSDLPVGLINLETGTLTPAQLVLMMNHLPVDITFVDENDKVCYFSTPAKRIFPRSKAIIGRDVHNCHPSESVHVVEEIVASFRNGKKNKASFWIRMKGELILIQYFALRDLYGNYKGVIEVSQEISEIQSLEGEQRLLDWEK